MPRSSPILPKIEHELTSQFSILEPPRSNSFDSEHPHTFLYPRHPSVFFACSYGAPYRGLGWQQWPPMANPPLLTSTRPETQGRFSSVLQTEAGISHSGMLRNACRWCTAYRTPAGQAEHPCPGRPSGRPPLWPMGRREWLGQKTKKEEKENKKEKRRKRKGAKWAGFCRGPSQMKMKWAACW